MGNNNDFKFTLKVLKDAPTEYVPDDKTILSKLRENYLINIGTAGHDLSANWRTKM